MLAADNLVEGSEVKGALVSNTNFLPRKRMYGFVHVLLCSWRWARTIRGIWEELRTFTDVITGSMTESWLGRDLELRKAHN